jgi:hypothetical protein
MRRTSTSSRTRLNTSKGRRPLSPTRMGERAGQSSPSFAVEPQRSRIRQLSKRCLRGTGTNPLCDWAVVVNAEVGTWYYSREQLSVSFIGATTGFCRWLGLWMEDGMHMRSEALRWRAGEVACIALDPLESSTGTPLIVGAMRSRRRPVALSRMYC